jgi:hypothetical protein
MSEGKIAELRGLAELGDREAIIGIMIGSAGKSVANLPAAQLRLLTELALNQLGDEEPLSWAGLCRKAGVSATTAQLMKESGIYKNVIRFLAEVAVDEMSINIKAISNAMVKKAKDGDVAAAKLVYQNLGMLKQSSDGYEGSPTPINVVNQFVIEGDTARRPVIDATVRV